mmetsp:Transcript_25710/g.71823  ORF Transcript_25710/g.71823 Transcript_25710/m.71823 type:complete len:586 (-) Transcript_25710:194-1951(-)|eukprot:CAMPEP_0119561538 /NCGR_PEP_ID=MMETSP1352-20130426/17897_1 /TAXON_ID=265584 /ORGANISM="Stauroneis constricta, Strain CCMP1120" /LENGTH=585 /DNA_ID=CAMNT_0007609759 /DNA_START=54 /DNA_END=1811 /DNA_ORIENTATION=-
MSERSNVPETPATEKKKRKADAVHASTPDGVTYHGPSSIARNQRVRGNRDRVVAAAAAVNTKTLQIKKSLYQQGIENINRAYLRYCIANRDSFSELDAYAVMVYLSNMMQHYHMYKALYDRPSGCIIVMGQNDAGQLGLSTARSNMDADEEVKELYPPTLCPALESKNIVSVAAGGMHSLAVTNDGKVYSWGCNDDGALARTTNDTQEEKIPSIVKGFESEDKDEVAMACCGDSHSLFLTLRGNVYMSGMYKDMDSGMFSHLAPGETSPRGRKFQPTKIAGLDQPVKQIASGQSFNVAILQDDSAVTWGMGHRGELARSADMAKPTLDQETGEMTYDLGKMFIGELDPNGQYNYSLDLIVDKFLTPKPPRWAGPTMQRRVVSVACGGFHVMVAARDVGSMSTVLYTSGLNNYGQLGHGDRVDRHELTPVEALEDRDIHQMAGGEHFSVALNCFGNEIYSWGRSDYGQLGLFTEQQPSGSCETVPKLVALPDSENEFEDLRFSEIAAGDRHALAITFDREVYTWGFGETGTVGHDIPDDIDCNRPMKLDAMRQYRGRSPPMNGLTAKVNHAAGGGQHSLMVIERYA